MKNLNGMENVLDLDRIYSGDNGQLFCGRHAGHTARKTGRDLYGTPVLPLSSDELEFISGDPAHPAGCEVCADRKGGAA